MSGFKAFIIRILLLAGIAGVGILLTYLTGNDVFGVIAFVIDVILFFVMIINHG